MLAFDENTKEQYKAYERQFDVVGNLYLSKKRISKNLFNYKTVIGGWIDRNNVIQNSGITTYCYSDYIEVEPNTTYTINLYDKTGLQSGAVLEYNTSKSYLNLFILETYTPITFTTSSNTHYVRFTCRQDSKQKVQLEKGSLVSDYEEYGVQVNDYNTINTISKNLINIRSISEYNFVLSNELKANTTYSLSFEGGPISYNIRTEMGGTVLISGVRENYCTFTTDNTGKAFFNGWNGNFPLTNFMLVEGNIALPYEEYGIITTKSKNLFDAYKPIVKASDYVDEEIINSGTLRVINQNDTAGWRYVYYPLNNVLGKTLTFKTEFENNNKCAMIQIYTYNSSNQLINGLMSSTNNSAFYGTLSMTYTFPSEYPQNIVGYAIGFYSRNGATTLLEDDDYCIYKNIMIYEGTQNIPYEAYNTTPFRLTSENECKILSFNINENTDMYHASLPYNTMTIDVDNEKGYFTDYDVDSIINLLNTDCYVDLFIKINDGYYYRIMQMNFDKITSSDYEKATLSFKSCISLLKTLLLKDNTNLIQYDAWSKRRIKSYLKDNYNLVYKVPDNRINTSAIYWYDDTEFGVRTAININTVEDMILQESTNYGNIYSTGLIINNANNEIETKYFKENGDEIILRDYQIEKSLLKREDQYRGVLRNRITQRNWEASNDTFNLVLTGKFTSKYETRMIRNNNYKLNTLTTSDVTITNGTLLNVYTNVTINEGCVIAFSGNIGDNYTITINKANMIKNTSQTKGQDYIGNIDDTTKILQINENAPFWQMYYYHFILEDKQVKSNAEAKIMALPYLELGDTIEIETDLANLPITITSINLNYDGGLTQTIKGYELWWDALFPADDLYPSDTLYPNTSI